MMFLTAGAASAQRRATELIRGLEYHFCEGVGLVQPGKEKGLGRPCCSLLVPKGSLQPGG